MIYNYPICDSADAAHMVNFFHVTDHGKKNYWSANHKILMDCCKLNIFMQGEFSVVVGEQVCSPVWGDLCFFAPFELHYGQVSHDTELDYFEFNIGSNAFDCIPDGKKLLSWLSNRNENKKTFARPTHSDAAHMIDLCFKIDDAVNKGNRALAYAITVQCISLFDNIYRYGANPEPTVLSKSTQTVIRYIEDNYDNITVRHLAEICGVSESWLSRSFKAEMGDTIHNYLLVHRMRKAVDLLNSHSVADVSYLCGFSDSSHFISQFKRLFGCTPFHYKKSGGNF